MKRFITKKVIAIAVNDVSESNVITNSILKLLFLTPNLPSIELRTFSSNCCCFLISVAQFVAGLPSGGPLIRSSSFFTEFSVFSWRINLVYMDWFWVITCVVFQSFYKPTVNLLIRKDSGISNPVIEWILKTTDSAI